MFLPAASLRTLLTSDLLVAVGKYPCWIVAFAFPTKSWPAAPCSAAALSVEHTERRTSCFRGLRVHVVVSMHHNASQCVQVAVTFYLRPALLATQEALQALPRLQGGVLQPLTVESNESGDWRSAAGAVLPPYTITARGGLETLSQWSRSEKPSFTACVKVRTCIVVAQAGTRRCRVITCMHMPSDSWRLRVGFCSGFWAVLPSRMHSSRHRGCCGLDRAYILNALQCHEVCLSPGQF